MCNSMIYRLFCLIFCFGLLNLTYAQKSVDQYNSKTLDFTSLVDEGLYHQALIFNQREPALKNMGFDLIRLENNKVKSLLYTRYPELDF